jgi:hypothetical protein
MEKTKMNLKYIPWGGVVGFLIASWLGPKVIALLFTPPVSFGLQCEPVGRWSMEKLISTQIAGFVLGMILTSFLFWTISQRNKNKTSSPTSGANLP